MADREPTSQITVKLPDSQIELINLWKDSKMFGPTQSAVIRALLQRAIDGLVESEYARKHSEMLENLRQK